jgi:hypothetical protein
MTTQQIALVLIRQKSFDFPHMRFKFKRITAVTRGHVGIQTNISERLNARYSMKLTNSGAA